MSSQRVELELLLASVFLELDLVPEGVDLEPEGVVFAHVVLWQRLEMLLVVAGVQALFVIVRAKILVELKRSLGRSFVQLHSLCQRILVVFVEACDCFGDVFVIAAFMPQSL